MDVKIVEKRNIKIAKDKSYRLIKVLYEGQAIWVSEVDFHKDSFPKEKAGYLILHEPVNEQYRVISKKNRKGMYLTPNTEKQTIINKDEKRLKINPKAIEKIKGFPKQDKFKRLLEKNKQGNPKLDNHIEDSLRQKSKEEKTPNLEKLGILLGQKPENMIKDQNLIKEIIDENQGKKGIFKHKKKFSEKKKKELSPNPEKIISSEEKIASEKVVFIKSLIELSTQKRTDENTRNRLMKLIGDEIGRSSLSREEVERIVDEKIGAIENIDSKHKNQITVKEKNENLPTYIDPSDLWQFLLAYNQDPILKYTCHEIDDQDVIDFIVSETGSDKYELAKHQQIIKKRYADLSKKYFVNPKIKALIIAYLTGTSYNGNQQTWSSDNIGVNWRSTGLMEWSESNPGFVPNPGKNLINKQKNKGYTFKEGIKIKITGQKINSFSKLMIHFKNLFHIRRDNSLKEIILKINQDEGWNDLIDFQLNDKNFWENQELFTDVDKLIQAYKNIIKQIIEATDKANLNKPIVEVLFKEIDNNTTFAIHHKNSTYQKSLSNTIERVGETQSSLIKNQINGLCDFYIAADFGQNQFAKINIWDGKERKAETFDNFEGVLFILIFRK